MIIHVRSGMAPTASFETNAWKNESISKRALMQWSAITGLAFYCMEVKEETETQFYCDSPLAGQGRVYFFWEKRDA